MPNPILEETPLEHLIITDGSEPVAVDADTVRLFMVDNKVKAKDSDANVFGPFGESTVVGYAYVDSINLTGNNVYENVLSATWDFPFDGLYTFQFCIIYTLLTYNWWHNHMRFLIDDVTASDDMAIWINGNPMLPIGNQYDRITGHWTVNLEKGSHSVKLQSSNFGTGLQRQFRWSHMLAKR